MDVFKFLYFIDYICYSSSNMIIYSNIVLFSKCWDRNLSIQDGVGKLNEDLHQPSRIRYESRSFSVRYLVSLAYRKGLISGVNLSVVVPQAIVISLRNKYYPNRKRDNLLSDGRLFKYFNEHEEDKIAQQYFRI